MKNLLFKPLLKENTFSLQNTLLATSILLILTISFLLAFVIIKIQIDTNLETQIQTAFQYTQTSAFNLAKYNQLTAENIQNNFQFAKNLNINKILIMNHKGAIEYSNFKKESEEEVKEILQKLHISASLAQSDIHLNYSFFSFFNKNYKFSFSVPIIKNNYVSSALYMGGEIPSFNLYNKNTFKGIILIIICNTVLIAIFLKFFIHNKLIKPINILNNDLKQLSKNEFNPLRKRPIFTKEIDSLFNSFETTATELIETKKNLEQNMETMQKTQNSLIKSEKLASIGSLAFGLAHELGNPIGAILGFNHLLKRNDLTNEEKKDYLKRSEDELLRMDEIIKNLLNFARPSKSTIGEVNITEVINSSLQLSQAQKWFKNISVIFNLNSDLKTVKAERNLLLQVILNLITNASHALTSEEDNNNKEILISAENLKDEVLITISDNGPGVSEQDVAKLFEPYFTKKRIGEGTGLGLAISTSIIDSFQGKLDFQHNQVKGASFLIYLPMY